MAHRSTPKRIAVIGPGTDDPRTMLGCYAFPNHVVGASDDLGLPIPTILTAIREEFAGEEFEGSEVVHARGCDIESEDTSGLAGAAALAASNDVAFVVVGDLAGLFGRGTSGEGCDRADLTLPGMQAALVRDILATGTPAVLVVVSGRPYALGEFAEDTAAIVQSFFPGVNGAAALAGVLSGRLNPSGRLPMGVPRDPGGQPATYRAAPLGRHTPGVTTLDPTPLFAFGHGLSYTSVDYLGIETSTDEMDVTGTVEVTITARNTGDRACIGVVQLYASDLLAQVARPVIELIGFVAVPLDPGQQRSLAFEVHADRLSFTGLDGTRIVEPGTVRFSTGTSAGDLPHQANVEVTGQTREVHGPRIMDTPALA